MWDKVAWRMWQMVKMKMNYCDSVEDTAAVHWLNVRRILENRAKFSPDHRS